MGLLDPAADDWRDTIAPQPSQADAWDATGKAYRDWQARDRAEQIRLGYFDPATGQMTPAGMKHQAEIIGGGFGPADIGMAGIGAIKAYHGSPHSFDRFDMSKIGTGEGAQAYGHGLYFAGNEGVARGYRDALSSPHLRLGDEPFVTAAKREGLDRPRGVQGDLLDAIKEGKSPEEALRFYSDVYRRSAQVHGDLAGRPGMPEHVAAPAYNTQRDYSRVADFLDRIDPATLSPYRGHMYEVNINAEPHQLLDWDRPVGTQAPGVRDPLIAQGVPPELTGKDAYTSLKFGPPAGIDARGRAVWDGTSAIFDPMRNPAEASALLREAGVPGVQYLDAGSRGAGQGSHNYAMFDDRLIDIMKKYAVPGMLGGAATLPSLLGEPDQGLM